MSAEQELKRFQQDALKRHFGVVADTGEIIGGVIGPDRKCGEDLFPTREALQDMLRARAAQMRKEADRLDKLVDETKHLSPDAEHALWEMATR